MVLLLMAFIMWKIKQKYDVYTRRQRLMVEMEAMASRPFRSIYLELQLRPGDIPSPAGGPLRTLTTTQSQPSMTVVSPKDNMSVNGKSDGLKKKKKDPHLTSNGGPPPPKGQSCNGAGFMHPQMFLQEHTAKKKV